MDQKTEVDSSNRLAVVREEMQAMEEHRALEEENKSRMSSKSIPSMLLFNIVTVGGYNRFFRYQVSLNRKAAYMSLPFTLSIFLPLWAGLNAYLFTNARKLSGYYTHEN